MERLYIHSRKQIFMLYFDYCERMIIEYRYFAVFGIELITADTEL